MTSVTKPLASTNEMVGGGNKIIVHKQGGMNDKASASTEEEILNYIKRDEGESIPVTRRGGAFAIDVEVKDEKGLGDDGFVAATGTAKRHQGVRPMECDMCDDGLHQPKHLAEGCCTESLFQKCV